MMKYKLVPCVAFTKEDMKLEAMNGEVSRLLKDKSLSSDDKMAFYEDLLARIKSYKSDMEGVKPSQPVIAGPVAAPPADDVPKRDKRSPPKGSVTKRTANKTVGGRVTKSREFDRRRVRSSNQPRASLYRRPLLRGSHECPRSPHQLPKRLHPFRHRLQ